MSIYKNRSPNLSGLGVVILIDRKRDYYGLAYSHVWVIIA